MKVVHCGGCTSVVEAADDACLALGKIFHTTCFVCSSCGRTLRGMAYYNINSKIYCEEDYKSSGLQDEAIRCHSCDHVIKDSILEAQGDYYHPGCFRCFHCEAWLDKIPFTVGKDNRAYCLKDYHKLFSPMCWKCNKQIRPVEGCDETVKVTSMEKDFHVDCFCCEICSVQLTDEPEKRCYPLDDHLLCHKCHLNWIKSGDNSKNILSLGTSGVSTRTTNKSGRRISSELVLEQVKRNSGVFNDHLSIFNPTSDQNLTINKSDIDCNKSELLNNEINRSSADTQYNKDNGSQIKGGGSNATPNNNYELKTERNKGNLNLEKQLVSHLKQTSAIQFNSANTINGLSSPSIEPKVSSAVIGQQTSSLDTSPGLNQVKTGGLVTSPGSTQKRRVRITDTVTYINGKAGDNTGKVNTSSLPRTGSLVNKSGSTTEKSGGLVERSGRIGYPFSYATSSLERRKANSDT